MHKYLITLLLLSLKPIVANGSFFGFSAQVRQDKLNRELLQVCPDLSGDFYTHNPDDGTLKTVSVDQKNCRQVNFFSREGCLEESFSLITDGERRLATNAAEEVNFITSRWKENELLVIFESNMNDPATFFNLYSLDEGKNLKRVSSMIGRDGVSVPLEDTTFIRFQRRDVQPIASE